MSEEAKTETPLPKVYQIQLTEEEFRWLRIAHNRQTSLIFGRLDLVFVFAQELKMFTEKIGGMKSMAQFVHNLNGKMAQLLPGAKVLNHDGTISDYQHDKRPSA